MHAISSELFLKVFCDISLVSCRFIGDNASQKLYFSRFNNFLSPFVDRTKHLVKALFAWEDGIIIASSLTQKKDGHDKNSKKKQEYHKDAVKKATGILMHIILLGDSHKIIARQAQLIDNLRTVISGKLDKRGPGSTDFLAQEIFTFGEFKSNVMKKIGTDENPDTESK